VTQADERVKGTGDDDGIEAEQEAAQRAPSMLLSSIWNSVAFYMVS